MFKRKWVAFLSSLTDQTTLNTISTEVRPVKKGGNRRDSSLVWDAPEFYFGFSGDGTVKELATAQGCGTDLQCLRQKVLEDLDVFDENMLSQLQQLVSHMHNPPFNSLKDWFTPIMAAVKKFPLKKEVFKKHMKSPMANMLIQNKQAKENVINKNRYQLRVNYSSALKVVQSWGASDDWRDQFLCNGGNRMSKNCTI